MDLWSDYWQVVAAFYVWRTVDEAKESLAMTIRDDPTVHSTVVEAITSNLRNFDTNLALALSRGELEVE